MEAEVSARNPPSWDAGPRVPAQPPNSDEHPRVMRQAFTDHWPEDLMEAALLGTFMLSA